MACELRRSISFGIGALLILFAIPLAQAATLNSWDIDITLNDDGSADWRIILNYEEAVQRDDYWIFGGVRDVGVTVDGVNAACAVTKPELGTSIICDKINGSLIVYSFHMPDAIGSWGDFRQFRYTFALTQLTDRFALKVSLPLGNALVDAGKLTGTGIAPFEPAFGKQGSDGRRIFVTWELQNPRLGETINTAVLYEPLAVQSDAPIIFIAIVAVVVAGIATYLFHFRRQPEHLLPALDSNEQAVMKIVIKQGVTDQADIVRATGFSKAKVSRIIQALTDRRLVEARPKGRTREIRLLEPKVIQGGLRARLLGFRARRRATELSLDRAQVVEIVQTTLTPLIDWLDGVIERLHKRKFGYAWDGSKWALAEGWERPVKNELWLKDLVSLVPDFEKQSRAFDKQVERLLAILGRVAAAISENKEYQRTAAMLARRRGLPAECAQNFIRHIIDDDKTISDGSYSYARVWNENATTLKRAARSGRLSRATSELEHAANGLARQARELKEVLEGIREHLRKRYHILYREYRK